MATKVDDFADEPLVIIKPKAYLTMLKHVLTYGNKYLENPVEVMGICYGLEEDGNLVQYEAVPIAHGGAIEVEFSPEDYAAFAAADEKMSEKGYYAIGWYHSHPGLKAFFSKVDIKNHLFYQKEQTPYAYGIVFDHEYFDSGDESVKYGFKAFRLDDFRKGMDSDYHEIKYVVELPDDLSYYKELEEIIEAIQSKKPIIKEAREELEGIGTWEVEEEPSIEEEILGKKEKKDEFEGIKSGLKEGISALESEFVNPVLDDFKTFAKDTQTAALKGPTVMIKTLEEMRDSISSGMNRVKGFFEQTLEKEIENVSESIEEMIKQYTRNQLKVPQSVNAFAKKVTDSLSEIIEEQLEKSLHGLLAQIKKVAESAQNIAKSQENMENAMETQKEILQEFPDSVQTKLKELEDAVGKLPNKINGVIGKRTEDIKVALDDLKQITDNLKDAVKDLSKVLLSKRK